MPVKILDTGSRRGFFRPGDRIVSIDGYPVEDQLDLHFRLAGLKTVTVRIDRDGHQLERRLGPVAIEAAEIVTEPMRFRSCASRCIFCFVDQMPPGLRESLYLKDDDYRLSFLYGNYVTLNDAGSRDMARIIDSGLSPLYVSVHATDPDVRARLFGRPLRFDIMRSLERLVSAGITVHAQAVIVPGINDGEVLERTIDDLARLYPGIRTLAVVPVGLTGHRKDLPPLKRFDREGARTILDLVNRKAGRVEGDASFAMCSDEFYLLARRAFPPASRYGEFEQLANGVGMSRLFIDETAERAEKLARRGRLSHGAMTLVSGRLGASVLATALAPVRLALPDLTVDVLAVRNRLFGDCVGVSGLLAGADIAGAAARRGFSGCLVLPPDAVNHEGVLIDDMKPVDLGAAIGARVIVPRSHFLESRVLRACEGG